MKKIDMTPEDYTALMENEAPSPKDSILTGVKKQFSPETSQSLASINGGSGGETFSVVDNSPEDTVGTPGVQSLEEPSRKASVKGSRKTSSKSGDSPKKEVAQTKAPKKDSKEPSDAPKKAPWEKAKGADKGAEPKSEEPKNKKDVEEALTFEDIAFLDECGDCGCGDKTEEPVREHEMGSSEIAMTKEFFKKLLTAAGTSLDDAKMDKLYDGMAGALDEDRALDVSDIKVVMDALRGSAAPAEAPEAPEAPEEDDDDFDVADDEIGTEPEAETGDVADDDFDDEDDAVEKAEGDGETADAEDGEEHEGKTKLMDADDEDDDVDDEEEVTESVKRNSKRQALREFWMASIKHAGVPADKPDNFDELDEEEIELLDIRRLSGLR